MDRIGNFKHSNYYNITKYSILSIYIYCGFPNRILRAEKQNNINNSFQSLFKLKITLKFIFYVI